MAWAIDTIPTDSLILLPRLKAWRKESSRDETAWAIDGISAKKESCFQRTEIQQGMFTLIPSILYAVWKEFERVSTVWCGFLLLVKIFIKK